MATVKVSVDKNIISKQIQKKLAEIGNPTTMLTIHNTLAKRCDPYVPFLEGPLSQTFQVSSEGVRYIQPYARYQYNGTEFNFTKDHHPLATAEWDKAMLRDHGAEFNQEVKEIIQRRLYEVNG